MIFGCSMLTACNKITWRAGLPIINAHIKHGMPTQCWLNAGPVS